MTRRKSHRLRRRANRLRREAARRADLERKKTTKSVEIRPDDVAEAYVTDGNEEARATGCVVLGGIALLAVLAWIAVKW